MKAVRIIGNILIGIILFALLFVLTFTRTTKSFLENDIMLGVVKERIVDTIKEGNGTISNKNEEILDSILKDNASSSIIRVVIDNFNKYQEDKTNFKVSEDDVEIIVNYANKYKNKIIEIYGKKTKDISDEEFNKLFSFENINGLMNEMFDNIDNDLSDNDANIVISTYSKATSSRAVVILISLIAFFIILLFLINWSLYKWMLVVGIDLIIVGILVSLVYFAGLIFGDYINSIDIVKKAINGISLNGYIVWGSIEIVVGIIMVAIYNFYKNKNDDEFKKLENL